MRTYFLAMLAFVPLALAASFFGTDVVLIFALSALAIIPLAALISDATEDLSLRAGPALGGLLNATFGNAPELSIGIFALIAGLTDIVKASIVGSILGNLLFGLGLAAYLGGRGRRGQVFNQKAARVSASVFLLAAAALVIPALFFLTSSVSIAAGEGLSLSIALLLLAGYAASLFFTLRTHKHLYAVIGESRKPERSIAANLAIMGFATLAMALMSAILVSAIEPMLGALDWSSVFVGGIVVALIGNAAEYTAAVRAALKSQFDLTIAITLSSATQMLMLVAPVLVVVGAVIGVPLTLTFPAYTLAALVFAIFLVNAVLEDGEVNWFEGFQLLLVYLVVAATFFFHP